MSDRSTTDTLHNTHGVDWYNLMQSKSIRIIIVSMPGAWQKMLRHNLGSHPSLKVLAVANGSLSAVQLVEQLQPDLIFIDSSIPSDDAITLIQKVKLENPKTKSVVLTDTTRLNRHFCEAGADYTLPTFNFMSQLAEIFENLGPGQDQPDSGSIDKTNHDEGLSPENLASDHQNQPDP